MNSPLGNETPMSPLDLSVHKFNNTVREVSGQGGWGLLPLWPTGKHVLHRVWFVDKTACL